MLQELRNFLSGRAFWFTMVVLILLTGYSFIQAVDLYSQASRSAVEYRELARGMVPFEGILVPMFPINEQVAERLGKSLLHSRTPRPQGFCLAPIPYIGAPSKSMY